MLLNELYDFIKIVCMCVFAHAHVLKEVDVRCLLQSLSNPPTHTHIQKTRVALSSLGCLDLTI